MSEYQPKKGSPKGGRVHWIPLLVPRLMSSHYNIRYDYDKHRYQLKNRCIPQKYYDEFLIVRTSEKCFRVMYYDNPTGYIEYTSYRKAIDLIDYLLYRYRIKKEYLNKVLSVYDARKEMKKKKSR